MRNLSLEKIYQGQVNPVGSIGHKRHLVLEYNTRKEVKDAITSANPELRAGADKRGAIRLQPVNKIVDREKYIEDFLKTLDDIDLFVTDIIKSGPDAPSSKFDSYVVKGENNKEFVITLGGGFNKGQEYEKQIFESISNYFDKLDKEEEVVKPSFLEKLEDNLDVDFKDIKRGPSKVDRALSDKGAEDVGEVIADFTLVSTENNNYHISLKNSTGITISNNGAAGMFDKEGDNVYYKGNDKDEISRKLFQAAGVDVNKVVDGLTDYIKEETSPDGQEEPVDTTSESDLDQLRMFLMSGFDYGYIYVKEKKGDGLEMVDLTTVDKLDEFLGDVRNVRVKYPYYRTPIKSRKNVSIILETEKNSYSFDVRNASGGILPTQINLVRTKSRKDIKIAKASTSSLTPEEQIFDMISNI
jgi:hypothetical protein